MGQQPTHLEQGYATSSGVEGQGGGEKRERELHPAGLGGGRRTQRAKSSGRGE